MKCHICNSDLTDIQWDSRHQEFDPCGTCMFIIAETVGAAYDKPYATEEDLSDTALEELYSQYEMSLDNFT